MLRGRPLDGHIKYGKLSVLGDAGRDRNRKILWLVRCDCGNEATKRADLVRAGTTQSCGCLMTPGNNRKHGGRWSREYRSWHNMKQRCDNPRNVGFSHYGGRGIGYCERWASFESFFADMGECPDGCTLDRIDVNGHYGPDNCRWATVKEQGGNKRNNRRIEHAGENLTLAQWAEKLGMSHQTIAYRLRSGMPLDKALCSANYRKMPRIGVAA